MVYSKDQKKIFYFDSFGDYNLEHAENTQKKIGLDLPGEFDNYVKTYAFC